MTLNKAQRHLLYRVRIDGAHVHIFGRQQQAVAHSLVVLGYLKVSATLRKLLKDHEEPVPLYSITETGVAWLRRP